jgi:hypothetical protein
MGSTSDLKWDMNNDGLSIDLPATAPDEMAVVFKIIMKK